jgi:vitamin B12 transporter
MIYVGTRLDTNNFVLGQYTLLNLASTYRASDRMDWFLRFDNLTNTEYEEIRGFGSPGLGIYGGLNLIW